MRWFQPPHPVIVRLAILLLNIAFITSCAPSDAESSELETPPPEDGTGTTPTSGSGEPPIAENKLERDLTAELIAARWGTGAAEEVVALNAEWFRSLRQQDPKELEREIALLARLGRSPRLLRQLEDQPEVAGLLAAAEDPDALARLFRTDARFDSPTLRNLFALYAAPADAAQLTAALTENGKLITELQEDGFLGSEQLFFFPRQGSGAAEYEDWLRDALEVRQRNDEERATLISFLFLHGDAIRKQLDDPRFRGDFRLLWAKLERILERNEQSLELYFGDGSSDGHAIWRLLELPQADGLLERWGPLAVDLLFGRRAYPPDEHAHVIPILQQGSNRTVEALMRFYDQPQFHQLLARQTLDPAVLARALSSLMEAGNTYEGCVSCLVRLSDRAIRLEMAPEAEGIETWIPLYYTLYVVPSKLWDDRPIKASEAVAAIADPLTFFIPGSKAAVKGARRAAQTAARKANAAAIRNAARRNIARQLGDDVAEVAIRTRNPWGVSQGMLQMRRKVVASVDQPLGIEITRPVLKLRKSTGANFKSRARLQRIDAQIHMTKDQRLLVKPGRNVHGASVEFLLDIADELLPGPKDLLEDLIAETPLGDEVAGVMNAARTPIRAWKQQLSAWWLANGTGLADTWETDPNASEGRN